MDYGPGIASDYQLRIQPAAFMGFISTFLAIAILSAAARTAARLKHYGTLRPDDWFLILAIVAGIACAGIAFTLKDPAYLAIAVGLKWTKPPKDFLAQMLEFEKRIQAASALIWIAIYSIKYSFMFFFRKLVSRVRILGVWWWVVMAVVTLGGLASIPLAFIICSDFTMNYIETCPIESQLHNERTYLIVTTTLDILTDVLIISVPVFLLWNVQISLRRKLALGGMLCLSAFMIIIAIVRLALSTLPNGVTDVSWLFFWQGIEAATAIIMVSLTAFPGLFGQEGSRVSNKPKKYVPTTKETGGTSTQRSKKSLLGVSASRPWKRFNLPSIPSATMTGMGTFAKYEGRGDRSAALREEDEMIDLESQRPLRRKQPKQGLSGGAGNSAENAEQRPNVVTAPTNEAGALTGARLLGPPIFTLHDHDFAYQEHGEDEDERQPSITSIPSPLSSESGSEETPGYETLLSKSTEETDPLAKRKLEIEAKKLKLADLKRQRLEREEVRRAEGKSDDDDRMLIVDLCSGERSEPDAGAPPPPPPKERAPQASPPMMAKSQPLVAKAQEIRRKQVPNQPDSQVSPTKGREKRSME